VQKPGWSIWGTGRAEIWRREGFAQGRLCGAWLFAVLALSGSDGRESRDQLVDSFATTVRARHFGLLAIGDVEMLGEFLFAVLAEENVLRHGRFSKENSTPVLGAAIGLFGD